MSRHHRVNKRRWAAARQRVLNRDGWRCKRCGLRGRLEIHHVTPLHLGGDGYALDNLETLCRSCHFAVTAEGNRRKLTPAEAAWGQLVAEAVAGAE